MKLGDVFFLDPSLISSDIWLSKKCSLIHHTSVHYRLSFWLVDNPTVYKWVHFKL